MALRRISWLLKRGTGAKSATYQLLRRPLTVKPVFLDWLRAHYPQQAHKVISRIRNVRDGNMNDAEFHARHRGSGNIAAQIRQTFRLFARKHALDQPLPALDYSRFRPPRLTGGQMTLF
jgi:DNA repair photolyase